MAIAIQVSINAAKCAEVAKILAASKLPLPVEDAPQFELDKDGLANCWFLLVAICHQTSPVGKPALSGDVNGQFKKGWDYLVHKFFAAVAADVSLSTPHRWSCVTADELTSIFGPNLSDASGRALLARDLGHGLSKRRWRSIRPLNDECHGSIPCLLRELKRFLAFTDPVEKKSVFLLSIMESVGIWNYKDSESLPPPVDYHEVRGHLRLNTISVEDTCLLRRIEEGLPVSIEEDVVIRATVRDAIKLIAEYCPHSASTLHYLFWNVFRNLCVRNTPDCNGLHHKVPQVYSDTVGHSCPFRHICPNANNLHAINEHVTYTDFY